MSDIGKVIALALITYSAICSFKLHVELIDMEERLNRISERVDDLLKSG